MDLTPAKLAALNERHEAAQKALWAPWHHYAAEANALLWNGPQTHAKAPKRGSPSDFLPQWTKAEAGQAKVVPLTPEVYRKRANLYAEMMVESSRKRKREAAEKAEKRAARAGNGAGVKS